MAFLILNFLGAATSLLGMKTGLMLATIPDYIREWDNKQKLSPLKICWDSGFLSKDWPLFRFPLDLGMIVELVAQEMGFPPIAPEIWKSFRSLRLEDTEENEVVLRGLVWLRGVVRSPDNGADTVRPKGWSKRVKDLGVI